MQVQVTGQSQGSRMGSKMHFVIEVYSAAGQDTQGKIHSMRPWGAAHTLLSREVLAHMTCHGEWPQA